MKILQTLLALLITTALSAQYDDVYFDPSEATTSALPTRPAPASRQNRDGTVTLGDRIQPSESTPQNSTEKRYDDARDGYEYSSRLRRFHNPAGSFGYYAPYYVDAGYYDPFYRTTLNSTVLIGQTGTFYRPARLTAFGPTNRIIFNSPARWRNSFYGAPVFGNNLAWNTGFGLNRGFGFGGWNGGFNTFNGVGGVGLYCPPSYYGNTYNVVGNPTVTRRRPVTTTARGATPRTPRTRTNRPVRTTRGNTPTKRARQGTRPVRSSTTRPVRRTTTPRQGTRPVRRATPTRRATPSRSTRPTTRTTRPSRSGRGG